MATVNDCEDFDQQCNSSSLSPLELLAQIASTECPLSVQPVVLSTSFNSSNMELVSDCSMQLSTDQILEISMSSPSKIEHSIHSQSETREVTYHSTSVCSEAVYYSKPISVPLLPFEKINEQNFSTVLPLIVDVNIDTPIVCSNVEVHSCPNRLSCTSRTKDCNFQTKPFNVSVSTPNNSNLYVPRRPSRFYKHIPDFSNKTLMTNSCDISQFSQIDKNTQTDKYTLQSISALVICLLLSASINEAFQFILGLISARFPHAHILKMVPDFVKIVLTGIHPKCWAQISLLTALRVKIRAGNKLYNHMRTSLYIPFPCVSSVNKFVQTVFCQPGVQESSIDRMAIALANANQFEKSIVLVFDEISISPSVKFFHQLKRIFGYPTLAPSKPSLCATHMLVVLARGLTTKFKVIVGWHLTAISSSRVAVKLFIQGCISSIEKRNIRVIANVSDMGIQNQSLFTDCGVKCKRVFKYISENNTIKRLCSFSFSNCILSVKTNDPIFYIYDPMHLFKCLRNTLMLHDIFVPDEVLEFYKIPKISNFISFYWVREFAKLQKNLKFPLIELTDSHLNPNHFEKMNVSFARRIFSRNVGAGIIRCIELNMLPEEARLTAHFILLADSWFKIISNRQRAHALCKNHSEANEDSFNKLLLFANFFAQCMVLNPKRHNCWAPVQKGILLSTRSFIDLARFLLSQGMEFLIAARLTSDSIESLFSTLRFITGPNANALRMCQVIKVIIASDLLNSDSEKFNDNQAINYRLTEIDENEPIDLISQIPILPFFFPTEQIDLVRTEREALYFIAGAIARYIYNLSKPLYIRKAKPIILCPTCQLLLTTQYSSNNSFNNIFDNNTIVNNNENFYEESRFTQLVNRGGLFFVSHEIFKYILDIEAILPKFIQSNFQSEKFLQCVFDKISRELVHNIPFCCNVPELVLKRSVLILSHRYLSSVCNTALSSDIISCDKSTSGGRSRRHLTNLDNRLY